MNATIKRNLEAAFLNYRRNVVNRLNNNKQSPSGEATAWGHNHRPLSPATPPSDETTSMMRMYQLSFAVDAADRFRSDRFDETATKGILYRPQIVHDLKEMLLDHKKRYFGLCIKGPSGIGKSHSIANLVQSLRTDGDIVTVIPDCQKWVEDEDEDGGGPRRHEFLQAICRSLGTTTEALGIPSVMLQSEEVSLMLKYVIEIFEQLNNHKVPAAGPAAAAAAAEHPPSKNNNKIVRWVFVFDEINRIFERPPYSSAKDIEVLPRPFYWMHLLRKYENVHVIVSGSANNGPSYKDHRDRGFVDYHHPVHMTEEEVKIWKANEYQNMDEKAWNTMVRSTGLCPLEISRYFRSSSREEYISEAQSRVLVSTRKLLLEETFEYYLKKIKESFICCILASKVSDGVCYIGRSFDKQYVTIKSRYSLQPVFPAVLAAYRVVCWDALLDYVGDRESEVLKTCENPLVKNDVRDRLFELLVLSRFEQRHHYQRERPAAAAVAIISLQPEAAVLPKAVVGPARVFESEQELPDPHQMEAHTLFFPKYSNFPAIDLIWKEGRQIWGIQVYAALSEYEDVLPKFRSMCETKGWFDSFDNIFLVYLSPSVEVKDALVRRLLLETTRLSGLDHPSAAAAGGEFTMEQQKDREKKIQVLAISKDDVECLKDIQWPSVTSNDANNMDMD